jgi:hypothetical protein
MATEWKTDRTRDTGNGALVHVSTSRRWPGVKQYEFVSYCGREEDKTWYEAVGDERRLEYSAPAKAEERYAECVRRGGLQGQRTRPGVF